MTEAASQFNPYNYEDQLRKAFPKEADRILVAYGHKERMPRSAVKLADITRMCKRCQEEFTPKTGSQMYCKKNSIGESCQKINKNQKLWKRRNGNKQNKKN